ncbi:MAG: hypothetical protein L0387_03885 [Acidobacteria bacterium]|nr:hypothetical protein [Acidobacteriota bacterium]
MAELIPFGSESGVSDFERGTDGFFTLAQASPKAAKTPAARVRADVAAIGSVNDPEVLSSGLQWSRQEYAGKKIRDFQPRDPEALATVLESLVGVEKVDIWAHGTTAGNIAIAGSQLNIASEELRAALANRRLTLGTVEFMSCDVGNNPPALARFGQIVGAEKVVGWTQIHALLPLTFHLSGDAQNDARNIFARLNFLKPFLPVGIPQTQQELERFLQKGHRSTFEVILEYWSTSGGVPSHFRDIISVPVAQLADLFAIGPNANGRRDAPELNLRDTEATEPLIPIGDIRGDRFVPGQPFNPHFCRVTVTVTKPVR